MADTSHDSMLHRVLFVTLHIRQVDKLMSIGKNIYPEANCCFCDVKWISACVSKYYMDWGISS